MIVRFTVPAQLPPPARTAVMAVQAALRVKRSVAQQLIHDGCVACGGRVLRQTHLPLQVGDVLEIDHAPQPARLPQQRSPGLDRFQVVHDEETFIVVNKPAGLLTVPTPKRESNTLQGQLRKWLGRQQPGADAVCVHRLDRLVSGLLVFAKDRPTADRLRDQFALRKPQRLYTAFVRGQPAAEAGTVRSYLSTDAQLTRYSAADGAGGELAITHYRVVEAWQDVSLLQIRLETGRRNQIRVHLAEQGHPILGDPRYAPRQAAHPLWPFKRIALHAETLAFAHPQSHQPLKFIAPWPQEFRDLRKRLGRRGGGDGK